MNNLIFASESAGLLDNISLGSILVTLIFLVALVLVVRAIMRLRRQPRLSTPKTLSIPAGIRGSIILLSISVILLMTGTVISITMNDALGGAIASISGVVAMIEQRRRHKREGNPDPPLLVRKK